MKPDTSEELGAADALKTTKKLNANDKQSLRKAIVALLAPKIDSFGKSPQQKLQQLIDETRIKPVDLNGDGVTEIIVQAGDDESCSPTGNCTFWILARSGVGFKTILKRGAVQTFSIQDAKTNGYRDLVLEMHGSAFDQGLYVYRFRDGRYQRAGCYNASWQRLVGDDYIDLKKPDITPCSR